jgi:hypothetical protein
MIEDASRELGAQGHLGWSIVKRGIVGTFHKVSAKYLPLYVNEFEFRYNNRKNADIFGAPIRAC